MKTTIAIGITVTILIAALPGQAQGRRVESPAVQKHVDAAKALAGTRYAAAAARQCAPPDARPRPTFADPSVAPVKLFDNLYYVGQANVYAWAVDTPEGIIMLDALSDAKDAEETVVGGLKKLGLDPARIKYAVISHAHADHFGGTTYLKQHYGARIIASEESWNEMEQLAARPNARGTKPPARDMVIKDGQTLTVGGTTLTFLVTPGHTKGTTSVILPVTDRGQRHTAVVLSGPRTETMEDSRQMLASTERLAAVGKTMKVDVQLTNHSYVDDSLPTIEAIRNRKANEPNPYVIGEEGFQRFVGWQAECLRAQIVRSEK